MAGHVVFGNRSDGEAVGLLKQLGQTKQAIAPDQVNHRLRLPAAWVKQVLHHWSQAFLHDAAMPGPPAREQHVGVAEPKLVLAQLRSAKVLGVPGQYGDVGVVMISNCQDASSCDVTIFFVAVQEFRFGMADVTHVGHGKLGLHLVPLTGEQFSRYRPHPGSVAAPLQADPIVPDWREDAPFCQVKQKGSQEAWH